MNTENVKQKKKILGKEDDIHSLVQKGTYAQGGEGIVGREDSVTKDPDKLSAKTLMGRKDDHVISMAPPQVWGESSGNVDGQIMQKSFHVTLKGKNITF